MNLVQGLQEANRKSREFLDELEAAAKAMGLECADDDPGLKLSATCTRLLIDQAEEAIGSGDVMLMLAAAKAHGLGSGEE